MITYFTLVFPGALNRMGSFVFCILVICELRRHLTFYYHFIGACALLGKEIILWLDRGQWTRDFENIVFLISS